MTTTSTRLFRLPVDSDFRPITEGLVEFNYKVDLTKGDLIVLIDSFDLTKENSYQFYASVSTGGKGVERHKKEVASAILCTAAVCLWHELCITNNKTYGVYYALYAKAQKQLHDTNTIPGFMALSSETGKIFWISCLDTNHLVSVDHEIPAKKKKSSNSRKKDKKSVESP